MSTGWVKSVWTQTHYVSPTVVKDETITIQYAKTSENMTLHYTVVEESEQSYENVFRKHQSIIVICSILYQRDLNIIHTILPDTQNQTTVEEPNRSLKHVIQACH